MLVLSRLRDETIMIGDDIEITIVDIRGDKVRLGISAPTRISVHRKEVYEAIRMENSHAARAAGNGMDMLRLPVSAGPQRNKSDRVRPAGLLQATRAGQLPASPAMPELLRRRDGPANPERSNPPPLAGPGLARIRPPDAGARIPLSEARSA